MNLLNLPDRNVERVEDSARDYMVHAWPAFLGYPGGPAYTERQARLLADVRQRYQVQVSDVLDLDR